MVYGFRWACPDGSNDSIARQQDPHEMTPIYRPENCQSAFQLNWSVAVFGQQNFPPKMTWYGLLKMATEADGVRILEVHTPQPRVAQFFVSTRPNVAPADVVRLLKGRWQYILRSKHPSAFRRNYFIGSVGDANPLHSTATSLVRPRSIQWPMTESRQNLRRFSFMIPQWLLMKSLSVVTASSFTVCRSSSRTSPDGTRSVMKF